MQNRETRKQKLLGIFTDDIDGCVVHFNNL